MIHARRLVAQRCLYGIDRKPNGRGPRQGLALVEHPREGPPTHLRGPRLPPRRLPGRPHAPPDRSLPLAPGHGNPSRPASRRCGSASTWQNATELRRRIREAGEEVSDQELHDLWHDARDEIDAVRLYGDLALAAFFAEAKPKQRGARRLQFHHRGRGRRGHPLPPLAGGATPRQPAARPVPLGDRVSPKSSTGRTRDSTRSSGIPRSRERNAVAAGNIASYPDWLKALHQESHGKRGPRRPLLPARPSI